MQPQPSMQPGQGQMQPPQDKGIVDTATDSVKKVSSGVTGFFSNLFGSETPAPTTAPVTGQPVTGQPETKQEGGRRRKRSHKKRSHKKRSHKKRSHKKRSKRSRRHR